MAKLSGKLLVAHSDGAIATAVVGKIRAAGAESHHVESAADAERELRNAAYHVVVIGLADGDSHGLLRTLSTEFPDVAVILLSAEEPPESRQSINAGSLDSLRSEADPEEIVHAATKALLRAATRTDEPPPPDLPVNGKLLGQSSAMQQVHDLVGRAASGTATVLIRGESGTGKELVARALHEQGGRAGKPFVKVHCAALPDSLLESELFGYERGAFTGATSRKPGRVELAEGGTLFLDEIGDITPAIQVKLLRLLQDKEYERLGGTETLTANVRFVAATHRDLDAMTKKGEFREDLYYRINVVTIWLPPLRARRDDVELLARHFCQIYGAANGATGVHLTDGAFRALRGHRWPGNVRQLQNFIERLVVLAEDDEISADRVKAELSAHAPFSTQATSKSEASPASVSSIGDPNDIPSLSEELRKAERRALTRALKVAKGNRTQAARILGVSRGTLYNKLDEHGLG